MSTTPLNRQNSADSLNKVEEISGESSSSGKEKQTTGSSTPPKKQLFSPWVMAQASVDALDAPKLQSKKAQTHLRLASGSAGISQPHTAPVKKIEGSSASKEANSNLLTTTTTTTSSELSSAALSAAEQFISIRTAVVHIPSSKSSPVIPVVNLSGNNASSNNAIALPIVKIKNEVDASELPRALVQVIDIGLQKDYILRPEQLANLMVAVESQCGKKAVSADNINAILREPLFITNYQGAPGAVYKNINIMERFCEPFIRHHLEAKILDELLQKVMREYAKVADKVTKLSEGLRPVEQVHHPKVVALMARAIKLMSDYFFGANMTLASSKLPDSIKNLFLAIDRQIINWFEKIGGDEMKLLMNLRKNALIGFLSTHSFMTIWGPQLAADTRRGAGFYAKLSSYINAYLVNKLDLFVMDILLSQEHQSPEQKTYVGNSANAFKLSAHLASTSRKREADKGSPLSTIKNLWSPKSKSGTISTVKRMDTSVEDSDFNEEENRQREMQRKRIVTFTRFAQKSGIYSISPKFYQFIRNKIIDLKANDYNLFTKTPVAYCHQQLKNFMQQADNKNIDPDIFEKITQSLNTYSGNLESDSDEEKSPYKSSLQGSVTDLSTVKLSGRGNQADHEDAATESSSSGAEKKFSEKNKDVQTASDLGSVKAESDSSTSVETEKSDE